MQSAEVPPVYTEYPTELPDSFPIGRHKVQPLVNVTELQAHLRLLGAIHKLKQDVQAQQAGVAASDPALAWVVFVNRSAQRFYKWAETSWEPSSPGLSEVAIPPLDVIMVWHSYLLNPRAYYEDSQRMSSAYSANLQTIQTMPLTLISSLIDPQTLEPIAPSPERKVLFERTTSVLFTMPIVISNFDVLPQPLSCPLCLAPNHLVQWVSEDGKGFAQPKFEYHCESCRRPFTKGNIGVRRFAAELTRKRTGEKVYLSETLLDPKTGSVDVVAANVFTNRLFETPDQIFKMNQPIEPMDIPEQERLLAAGLKYDYNTLLKCLHYSIRPNYKYAISAAVKPLPRIQRLAVAYSVVGPASLDLIGAVLRQGGFIEKMVGLGWTQPGRFDGTKDSAPLVRSVARYHAFLDLMQSTTGTFCVPTLDIDLSWHSHQLKSPQYRSDTLSYLGRTPNHDDNVEVQALSTAYDITAKAWRARFGVPYSVCGCVSDPDQNSGISKLVSKISRIGGKKDKSYAPISTPVNNRPDLVSTEEGEADESHPSEHNVQFGDPGGPEAETQKSSRDKKAQKCADRAKKAAAKDPWRALQAERRERDHREAFTDPYHGYGYYYSYWGVSMAIPYGYGLLSGHHGGIGLSGFVFSDFMVGMGMEAPLGDAVRDVAGLDVAGFTEVAVAAEGVVVLVVLVDVVRPAPAAVGVGVVVEAVVEAVGS